MNIEEEQGRLEVTKSKKDRQIIEAIVNSLAGYKNQKINHIDSTILLNLIRNRVVEMDAKIKELNK